MPTYDYRCETCESHFEFVQSFSDDSLKKCPGKRSGGPVTEACTSPGRGKVVKVFSKVGIAFKGDGFYKNDHGSAAKKKADASANGESSKSSESSSGSDSSKSASESSKSTDTTKKSDAKASTSSD